LKQVKNQSINKLSIHKYASDKWVWNVTPPLF